MISFGVTQVLLSLPVLLLGSGLALGLRSNRAAAQITILTQLLATTLGGGRPVRRPLGRPRSSCAGPGHSRSARSSFASTR